MPPAQQNAAALLLLDLALQDGTSDPGTVVGSVTQNPNDPESGLCWEIHRHAELLI